MDGVDPDASLQKRPRLGSVPPLYSGLHPPPQQQAVRHTILPAAPSPPNHYPPHTLPPPTQPYPPPPSVTPFDSRSLSDSRALPALSPLNQRPGHGASVSLPPRSYSQDSSYARPPGTPSQLAPSDPRRRSIASDGNHPPMDHGGPQPVYISPEHHHNGGVSNGYPIPSPHEQYGAPPMSANQAYTPAPVTPYPPSAPYGPAPTGFVGAPRRKQVRATQACNNCRQRKQKCDENRPCQFCKDNAYECAYKDVPPPKQDRTMMQVLDGLRSVADKVDGLISRVGNLERRLPKREPSSSSAVSPQYASPSLQNDHHEGEGFRLSADTRKASSELATPLSAAAMPIQIHSLIRHDSTAGLPIKQESISRTENAPRTDNIPGTGNVPHPEDSNEKEEELEIALPGDHSTAAHQLLEIWPSMQPFYTDTGAVNTNYPMENEERRGLLRIYGRGQGTESENTPPVGSPAGSSHSDEYQTPSPREGLWGTGLAAASPPTEMRRSDPSTPGGPYHDLFTKGNPGGLNPDGSLKLDVETVRALYRSYLQNIDILHPFLDRGRLGRMIEQFMLWYSPDVNPNSSPRTSALPGHVSASEHHGSIPLKRKHSNGPGEFSAASDISSSSMKRLPERSIGNAIILLVLALGKVCEHKKVLPGPVGEIPSPLEHPSQFVKRSPGSSNATLGGSPFSDGMYHIQRGRQHSTDAMFERKDANLRNIDILPGLAYYAYATDILGNLHGGNEVAHAQAFLLAGLYMGQYARVLESWSWIYSACRVCGILIKKREDVLKPPTTDDPERNSELQRGKLGKLNLVRYVFWTCLQLESDILAELSNLPPSGISRYQEHVGFPAGVYNDMPAALPPNEEMNMIYYSAQIQLRKILNRAHKALYSKSESYDEKPKNQETWSWAADKPEFLEEQINEWRQYLPPALRWDDEDPPATDINNARMRAKYYGAKYIIARPFLHLAVHHMSLPPAFSSGSQQSSPAAPVDCSESGDTTYMAEMSPDQRRLFEASKICVNAAIQSTIAFDRVGMDPGIPWKIGSAYIPERFIVTNIFGTLHAQFGNMLVLAAVYKSRLRQLIDKSVLDKLLARTIKVLRRLAPNSPTLKVDAQILENTRKVINGEKQEPMSASLSFDTLSS